MLDLNLLRCKTNLATGHQFGTRQNNSKQLMNRKKKIKTTLMAKKKKANAKLHKPNKPKYISKAERTKLAEQEGAASKNEGCEASQESNE